MKRYLLAQRRLLRAALSSTTEEGHRHLTIRNNVNILAPSRQQRGMRNSFKTETTTTTTPMMKQEQQQQQQQQQHDNHLPYEHDERRSVRGEDAQKRCGRRGGGGRGGGGGGGGGNNQRGDERGKSLNTRRKSVHRRGRRQRRYKNKASNDDPYRRLTHLYYTFERLQYQFPLHYRHPISKHWELVDKTFKVTEEYSKLSPPKRKHVWLNTVSILSRLAFHENGYRNHIIFDDPPWGAEKQSQFETRVKFKVCAAHAVTNILFFFVCPSLFFGTEILLRPEGVDGFPQMQNLAKVLNETFPSVFENGLTEFFAGVAAILTYVFRNQTEKVYLTFASFSASFRNADMMKRILQIKL